MSSIRVAVGVIVNQKNEICISLRQKGQHLAGCWEFPGGKIEADESVFQALKRELYEELGLDVLSSTPLTTINFEYPEKHVCLEVHSVRQFSGEAIGKEQQEVRWVLPLDLPKYTFPEANKAIIDTILQVEEGLHSTR
ncbi:MAG: 8-oxo-dGTP diphosphatase MutT [Agarilytica sp.]